ncbi:MAG: hypothetical protein AAGA95_19045, partial [Pseudomonadota bacterium]
IAVSEGDLRYVTTVEEGGSVAEELFDASTDPGELRNRATDRPEDLARLRAVKEDYEAMTPAWGEAPARELNEMELNQLRALGYALP